ncbi:hypothetical protein ACSQ5K_26560 [Pseudomonas sp. PhalM4]
MKIITGTAADQLNLEASDDLWVEDKGPNSRVIYLGHFSDQEDAAADVSFNSNTSN